MDIYKLKHFCSVANHLSFSKAAEECHIAQTAMSRNIASLEEELGFQLFFRNRHKVELTPAGTSFLPAAMKIISDFSLAQQAAIEVANGGKGQLSIGFGGFDICYIRDYVPEFIRLHPEYTVSLREFPYDAIVEALISRQCDVVFAPNSRLSKQAQLRRLVTSNCNDVIGVGRDHPLYGRSEVYPDELDGQTFICAYDTSHSWFQLRQFERTCDMYGIHPGKRLYTNTAVSLLTMVEFNQGVSFLTENISTYDMDIKKLPIIHDTQVTKVHVAACNNPSESTVTDEFMNYLELRLKENN